MLRFTKPLKHSKIRWLAGCECVWIWSNILLIWKVRQSKKSRGNNRFTNGESMWKVRRKRSTSKSGIVMLKYERKYGNWTHICANSFFAFGDLFGHIWPISWESQFIILFSHLKKLNWIIQSVCLCKMWSNFFYLFLIMKKICWKTFYGKCGFYNWGPCEECNFLILSPFSKIIILPKRFCRVKKLSAQCLKEVIWANLSPNG